MACKKYLLVVSLLLLGLTAVSAYAADSWSAGAVDLPSALLWDQSKAVSVEATNDGTTTWDTTFALRSVQGATATAEAIDRWGTTSVAVTGTVAPAASQTFDFNILAPAITTLAYPAGATATTPPVVQGFDDNWNMANGATLITTATAAQSTVIRRFPDTMIGVQLNDWATAQIEQCAGRLPLIVGGYPDGKYHPEITVTRDQMAEFIRRAAVLPTGANDGHFVDVPLGFWAEGGIFGLVNANIVAGYDPTHYKPANAVTRDQMAVFIARGLCGGMDKVPVIPTAGASALFSDVPVGFWAYDGIAYCIGKSIVGGYGDGSYKPGNNVTRDQMAVFIYRSFIQPTGSIVVLAGPDLTAVDTDAVNYDGWSPTNAAANEADPGVTAYVGFDKRRMAGHASFDVKFELLADDDSVAASQTVTVDPATATGDPYTYAKWALPAVAAGHYRLQTTIAGAVSARVREIWVGAPAAPIDIVAVWGDAAVKAASPGDIVGNRQVVAGSLEASMAAKDGVCFETERTTFPPDHWCGGDTGDALLFQGVPAGATTLSLNLTYSCNTSYWGEDTGSCCGPPNDYGSGQEGNAPNCCDSWGTLDPAWSLALGQPPVHTTLYSSDGGYAIGGWGLRVMSQPGGGLQWQTQWYDNDGYDLVPDANDDDDFWVLRGSGDPNLPADNDIQGGGEMYSHIGFTGNRAALTTYQWGSYHAPRYVADNGDVIVGFCGGSWQTTRVDQAVLTVGFGAPPLF